MLSHPGAEPVPLRRVLRLADLMWQNHFEFLLLGYGAVGLIVALVIAVATSFVAYWKSDAVALAPLTRRIVYLEDGDWAVVRRDKVEIFDRDNRPVERER